MLCALLCQVMLFLKAKGNADTMSTSLYNTAFATSRLFIG